MAALGRLVAGVAHELNTPLGALKGNVQLSQRSLAKLKDSLEDGLPGSDPTRILEHLQKLVGFSVEAVDRTRSIVTDLRRFARLDEVEIDFAPLDKNLDCVFCHGEQGYGEGPEMPDWTSVEWQDGRSDTELAESIRDGKGTMPKFEVKLTPDQIDAAVKFVRSVRGKSKTRMDCLSRLT